MTCRGSLGLAVAAALAFGIVPMAAAQRDASRPGGSGTGGPGAGGIGSVIEVAPAPAPRGGDRSGRARDGEARVLTDRAYANVEATGVSGVLPEGTTARVVNLENGRSTFVRVRGGGAAGRLLDITPPVARLLGVTGGEARLRVVPLAVPQADGTIRLGAGTPLAGQPAAPAVSDRPED